MIHLHKVIQTVPLTLLEADIVAEAAVVTEEVGKEVPGHLMQMMDKLTYAITNAGYVVMLIIWPRVPCSESYVCLLQEKHASHCCLH